jgi:hypothetical protein
MQKPMRMCKLLYLTIFLFVTKAGVCQKNPASTKTPLLISAKGDTVHLTPGEDNFVHDTVEVNSSFPGGDSAWYRFLYKHLRYPKVAIINEISGIVTLQFIVCEDGTVCNIKGINGPPVLQKAAIEAFSQTPRWIPATQNGRKVKSYKKQSFAFSLGGY